MELKAKWRSFEGPIALARPALPALPALMVTSVAVAAIAQPLANAELRRPLAPARQMEDTRDLQFATLRLNPETASKFGQGTKSAIPLVAPGAVRAPPAGFVPLVRIALPPSKPAESAVARSQDDLEIEKSAPKELIQPRPNQLTPPLSGAPLDTESSEPGSAPSTTRTDFSRRLVDEPTWMSMARAAGRTNSDAEFASNALQGDDPAPLSGRRQPIFHDELLDESARLARPAREEAPEGISHYSQTRQGIAFTVPIQVNRAPAGDISLLIEDGKNISVRLTDILSALKPVMAAERWETLSNSQAAQEYVTLNDLRAAGIDVRFAPDDRLILSAS